MPYTNEIGMMFEGEVKEMLDDANADRCRTIYLISITTAYLRLCGTLNELCSSGNLSWVAEPRRDVHCPD